jgi:hypothetical protein
MLGRIVIFIQRRHSDYKVRWYDEDLRQIHCMSVVRACLSYCFACSLFSVDVRNIKR